MKRYGNLYEKIYSYENLQLAHQKARKDKSFYREVKMVDANEECYLLQIQNMLIWKTYSIKSDDYTAFKKMDKGKEREIFKLDYFPHRIVQHALMNVIEEYLKSNLDLDLKQNWQVFPTRVRGVDFVGYRHFDDYVLLRKSTSKNMKKKLRKIYKKCRHGYKLSYSEWCSVNSYKGWLQWCNGYNLYCKYIEPLEFYTNKYYKGVIKK
ncbi:hypothetical protein [Clostridium cochlearium]|uniref:hypothetical protein n=1 Tax=Clostridium cochlearium TaxID=1494 RepID=UPI000BBBA804|nr:hypothetical protein [Clostridium cochlearium]